MQVIPDSLFVRPGSAPIGGGRKESSGTGLDLERTSKPCKREGDANHKNIKLIKTSKWRLHGAPQGCEERDSRH